MSRLTLQEYLNERIKNVEHYIKFNERKDDKNFFAYKELELYQMAQKYMLLTNELGCSLEMLFDALKNGIDMDGDGTLFKPRLYYDDVYKQWKFKVYYTPTACGFYNVKDWVKELKKNEHI